MKLSERLESVMHMKGVKPAELSKASGVGISRISEILSGKTKNPRSETLVKIANSLGVPLSDILHGSEDSFCEGEGMSPEEREILRIVRECPEAGAVVRMMGDMDSDTQKGIQHSVSAQKSLIDQIKELRERQAG